MREESKISALQPRGAIVLSLAAVAGGFLLFAAMLSMRMEQHLPCPSLGLCLPTAALGGFSQTGFFSISILTWKTQN